MKRCFHNIIIDSIVRYNASQNFASTVTAPLSSHTKLAFTKTPHVKTFFKNRQEVVRIFHLHFEKGFKVG